MKLIITVNGLLGVTTTSEADKINVDAVNSALVPNPANYASQISTYGSFVGTSLSLDSSNNIALSNAPTDFNKDSLQNFTNLIASNLGTGTQNVSILLAGEFNTARGALESYGFVIKWDGSSANKIYPQDYTVNEGTGIAIVAP